MRIKLPVKSKQPRDQWHTVFLWRPRIIDGHLVWLERVNRLGRLAQNDRHHWWGYTYALIDDKPEPAVDP